MPKNGLNVALKGVDEIFSTEESRHAEQREQVQQIPIAELFPFKNHPFRVQDDEEMENAVKSISQYGVLTPLIARPRKEVMKSFPAIAASTLHSLQVWKQCRSLSVICRTMPPPY